MKRVEKVENKLSTGQWVAVRGAAQFQNGRSKGGTLEEEEYQQKRKRPATGNRTTAIKEPSWGYAKKITISEKSGVSASTP